MKHTEFQEKFLDLLEGKLPEAESKELLAHLDGCADCKRAFEDYKQVVDLESLLSEQTAVASPQLAVKVMDRIEGLDSKRRLWSTRSMFESKLFVQVASVATVCLALLVINDTKDSKPELWQSPKATSAPDFNATKLSEEQSSGGKIAAVPLKQSKEVAAPVDSEDKSNSQKQDAEVRQEMEPAVRSEEFDELSRKIENAFSRVESLNGRPIEEIVEQFKKLDGDERADSVRQLAKVGSAVSAGGSSIIGGGNTAVQGMGHSVASSASDAASSLAPSRLPVEGQINFRSYDARRSKDAEKKSLDEKLSVSHFGTQDQVLPNPQRAFGRGEHFPGYGSFYPGTPPLRESRENYAHYEENPRQLVSSQPVSTFSIDVDNGSYTNARRFLSMGQLPPADAVRVEEFINYFDYKYEKQSEKPFSVQYEVGPSPLESGRYLLKVGIRARDVKANDDAGWNLVFLVDVSGSMGDANKLELVKQSLRVLANKMRPADRVAIVTYAGDSRILLESTPGNEKEKILSAISQMNPGGSTNGGSGIEMAYGIAERNKKSGGVNRVILATDGDFNVGTTDFGSLVRMVEEKRKTGVGLTTIGVGSGNYNEQNLEQLANKGNGNYFYFDSFNEARRVLETRLVSTIETVAKDVKLQMEFNPANVKEYRLIGFDNRKLEREDFANDKVDAGEIGSGHTVTALYELVLANTPMAERVDGQLRYQTKAEAIKPLEIAPQFAKELGFLKVRYKEPNEETSKLLEFPISAADLKQDVSTMSDDFRFAAAVAYFGQTLRQSKYKGDYSLNDVATLARNAVKDDESGDKRELIKLIENAAASSPNQSPVVDATGAR